MSRNWAKDVAHGGVLAKHAQGPEFHTQHRKDKELKISMTTILLKKY